MSLYGMLLGSWVQAQIVQSVGTLKKNVIPVYIADFPEEADLHVFTVTSKKQAIGNQGLWYFQDSQTYAEKKIFFVDTPAEAQLTVFFVEEKAQAGWLKRKKQVLLE